MAKISTLLQDQNHIFHICHICHFGHIFQARIFRQIPLENTGGGICHSTYDLASQICCSLNWITLEQRRVDFGLCMLYKIRNHLIAAEEEHYVQRRTGRRSHQYRQLRAVRYYTRFFFFPRTIIQWNQLSSQTCMTSRSTSSRHRSWRSTIQDSINFQDIFSFYKYCYTLSRGLCAGVHCTHPFSQCA